MIQDSPFLLLNIYAPNDTSEQCTFLSNILEVLDEYNFDSSSQLIIRGDFNVHFNAVLDNTGGKIEKKRLYGNCGVIKILI